MTTPGGVPNLPVGALTLDTLASKLQDMSGAAMKERAVEQFPAIMDNSTGLNPASDFTPFGILTSIFAGFNSLVANADPADIDGPEDLPQLVLDFIEGLPVVGQFVGILEAFLGTYDGDDAVLLGVQNLFAPIRKLLQLFSGADGIPTVDEITTGVGTFFGEFGGQIQQLIDALVSGLTGSSSTGNNPVSIALALLNQAAQFPGHILEQLFGSLAGLQAQVTGVQNNPGGTSTTDDFTANVLTGRRTNVTGTMAISARGKYLQTPNVAADYMGTTGTPRKPATNKCGSSVTLDAVMQGVTRAWVCGDNVMANYVAVEFYSGFDGDAVRIVSGSSPTLTVVQAQFDLLTAKLQAGNTFDIRYDPTPNTYTVSRNGPDNPVLSWTDSGNLVTHAGGKTFTGAVTNGDDRNEDGFYGPGIRKQTFYDW